MADVIEQLRLIKYALLQLTIGPSLICDIIVFTYFIRHWRKEIILSPHNHAIVCLLIASFVQKTTDVPFLLYYLRWGVSIHQSYSLCVIWNWLDYTLISCSLHLLAWFCIERHLFVFHSQIMKKKWCLIIFHYIPLIICSTYASLFYLAVIFFPTSCTNIWDYSEILCGSACYTYYDPFLGTFDWLFHYGTPIVIIFCANIFLLCRIKWQKNMQRRPIEWRRRKWMIIQLIFISTLYLILQSPGVIVGAIQGLWLPTFAMDIQLNYFYYICYFINQFLPFVIVSSLPQMHKEIRQSIERVRRRFGGRIRIHPIAATTAIVGNRGTTAAGL